MRVRVHVYTELHKPRAPPVQRRRRHGASAACYSRGTSLPLAVQQLLILLIVLSTQAAALLPGFGDRALYANATRYLVGAQSFLTFSSGAVHLTPPTAPAAMLPLPCRPQSTDPAHRGFTPVVAMAAKIFFMLDTFVGDLAH